MYFDRYGPWKLEEMYFFYFSIMSHCKFNAFLQIPQLVHFGVNIMFFSIFF